MSANKVLSTCTLTTGQKLHAVLGDITYEEVDAIVNAANSQLAHGGGVAAAIVRRGGEEVVEQSKVWIQHNGPVSTGSAAITGGGDLPARYVIHAVGPVWRDQGDEPEQLRSAVQSALAMADDHLVRSISLPAISSGIYGFPKPLAAQVIWNAVVDYFSAHPDSGIEYVRFCNIDQETADLFVTEAKRQERGELPQVPPQA